MSNIFKTLDIDFAAVLISQEVIFAVEQTVEDGRATARAVLVDMPRVEIHDLVPYRDPDARDASKSVRYEFHLRGLNDDEPEHAFRQRMRTLSKHMLNRRVLVEPTAMLAWKRQFRAWMTETDEERKRLINESRRTTTHGKRTSS